jgi:hypothetical protein
MSYLHTNIPFQQLVAQGQIPGHSFVHKFGYNPDIDTLTDPETVWSHGGLYPWSALDGSSQTLYVKSSSGSDTMPITFYGLNNAGAETSDTVTLTGTSAVTSNINFKRIYRAFVTTSTENIGNITWHTESSAGPVVCEIAAGEGQTLMALYTIPTGKTGYLYTGDCSVNLNKEVTIKFYVRYPGGPFRIAHVIELASTNYRYDFPFPVVLPAGSDLEVRVDNANDNNCRVSANFDILLRDI